MGASARLSTPRRTGTAPARRRCASSSRWCDDIGVRVVSLYLLSNDNLRKRDSQELDRPHRDHRRARRRALARAGLARAARRPRATSCPPSSPACSRMPRSARARQHGLHVNLAVGYGGRNEIVDAVRSIITKHDEEGGTLEELAASLTPEQIGEHLYTGGQPDPDLVIRTSGEQRLSDFLLWQSAHSEFYFVEALGPDLREVDFLRAIRDFAIAGSALRRLSRRLAAPRVPRECQMACDRLEAYLVLVRRRTRIPRLGGLRAPVAGRAGRGPRGCRAARLGQALEHRPRGRPRPRGARSARPSCSAADAEQVVAAALDHLRPHAGDLRPRRAG